jgi:hypothetical protein
MLPHAIENKTFTLEQVTAVINSKHMLGNPREIQEVRNALAEMDFQQNLLLDRDPIFWCAKFLYLIIYYIILYISFEVGLVADMIL